MNVLDLERDMWFFPKGEATNNVESKKQLPSLVKSSDQRLESFSDLLELDETQVEFLTQGAAHNQRERERRERIIVWRQSSIWLNSVIDFISS